MDFIVSKDLGASFAMEMLQRPWLTRVMHFVTALGNPEELRVVAVLSALFFIFIGRWRTGICLIVAGLLGMAIESTVKPWVQRPRPDLKWVAEEDRRRTPSFPSGHALLSMAVYGSLGLGLAAALERRKQLASVVALVGLILPLLISFSRMYLGVHYMSDVVGGLLAGLGCALLLHWIDEKWTTVAERLAAAKRAASADYELLPPDAPLDPVPPSPSNPLPS